MSKKKMVTVDLPCLVGFLTSWLDERLANQSSLNASPFPSQPFSGAFSCSGQWVSASGPGSG